MNNRKPNKHWVVWITVFIAYLFSIVALPVWMSIARPAWVTMVVIYWIMALPERFGLLFGFSTGLLLDLFVGTPLGENAISMLFISLIVLVLHRRLRMFSWWQQAFIVFVIVGFYQLLILWIKSAFGQTQTTLWYLVPALTSATLWPWVSLTMRHLRRNYRIR